MSTLVAQTISNGTVSTSSANVIQGSAKAWVKFAGASGTIAGSFNVSSVTFNSTGSYTVNFTTAMTDANYCAQVTAGDTSTTGLNITDAITNTYTTTTLLVQTFTAQSGSNTGRSFIDETFVNVSVFR